jgi:hypothetical protein
VELSYTVSEIVVGGLVLAAVTCLPNAVVRRIWACSSQSS